MKKGTGTIEGEDFRRLQQLELDMLVELDRVCRKHGIRYSLVCGTLLGAVRHKGFIPWDDDIDVAMLREDYEAFRSASADLNQEICFFQDHKTDPQYLWGFGKLRRTGTTYIRPGQEKMKFKTGVYIDILPLDDIPRSTVGQKVNDFYCFFLRKTLWSRVGRSMPGTGRLEKAVYRLLSHISPEWVYQRVDKMTSRSNNKSDRPVRTLLLPSGGKEKNLYSSDKNPLKLRYGMPKQWFLEQLEFEYEGHSFYGVKDYHAYLTSRYGNYMQLPPVEKQVGKAPAAIWEF